MDLAVSSTETTFNDLAGIVASVLLLMATWKSSTFRTNGKSDSNVKVISV